MRNINNSGGFDEKIDQKNKLNLQEDENIQLPITNGCIYCLRVPIDLEVKKAFEINVCTSCTFTEMKFITKSKCKAEYLLTEEEIKQFKCLFRPNPHKGSWSDMQLFREEEIKEFSLEKHGSLEKITQIQEERVFKKKEKKILEIRKKVKELKKRTFIVQKKDRHVHVFVQKGKKGICECGMEIEQETL